MGYNCNLERIMSENTAKKVAARVKEIRRQLGLSQAEFGRRLGCTGASVSEIEKGRYKPNFDLISGMVEQFDVNIFYLLFGLGEVFKDGSPPPLIPRPASKEVEMPGFFFPESALKVDKEEFKRFHSYLEGSSIVQYKLLAYFQEQLERNGPTITKQKNSYQKKKK